MTTLSNRLRTELIGDYYNLKEQHRQGINDRDDELLALGANGCKDKQYDRIKPTIANIEADLKWMIADHIDHEPNCPIRPNNNLCNCKFGKLMAAIEHYCKEEKHDMRG